MDTQTFLNNLEEYADRYKKSPQSSSEFFDYMNTYYEMYISATPEERTEIRTFIKGKLFHSNQIAYALLRYVRERALQQLKSTRDERWLRRGIVALSMENFSGKFDDNAYVAYPMKGDASFLLADLYVTAEQAGSRKNIRGNR